MSNAINFMTQQNPTNWINLFIHLTIVQKVTDLSFFMSVCRATMDVRIMQFHLSWTLLNFIVTSKCRYCYPNYILFYFFKVERTNNGGKTVTETDLFKYIGIDKRISNSQWTTHTHMHEYKSGSLYGVMNNLYRSGVSMDHLCVTVHAPLLSFISIDDNHWHR